MDTNTLKKSFRIDHLDFGTARLVLFGLVNFFLTFFLSKYILNTDDFLNHAIAHQITKGQHLYTSITLLLPPLNFYLIAALRLLPTDPEFTYRVCVGIISATSAVLLQLILRNTSGRHLGDALAFFTLFGHFLLIPTIWYGNNAALCVLVGLYFLSKPSLSISDNIWASIAFMMAVFFKQNIGIPAVLVLFLFGWIDGIKLASLRIFVAGLTAISILTALTLLSGTSFANYLAIFWEHNFTLIQEASTRSLTVKHVFVNVLGGWVDFSSDYYKHFLPAYALGIALLALSMHLSTRVANSIFVGVWLVAVLLATCFIVLTRLHSHHAFFNVIFVSILCLIAVLVARQIESRSFSRKIVLPLLIGAASMTGALLKGPWGIVEVYNLIFASIGLLLGASARLNYKALTYLFSAVFLQVSVYNFAVFFRDFKSIDWEKFQQVDVPGISGFRFYNNARTYQGLSQANQWLENNGADKSFFVFPPEVPLHLVRNDIDKTGVINTSKNIFPHPMATTIIAIERADPDVILWKLDHTQVEATSFFTDKEKETMFKFVSSRYNLVDQIQNYRIYTRK